MKQTIKEEIIRAREIMGLNSDPIITEGKDDKVNKFLTTMFAGMTEADEEFSKDLYDCVKKNAKVHNITLSPNMMTPAAPGLVKPATPSTGIVKEHEASFFDKLKAKLKGVSEEQMEYNRKHNLPIDWQGSKEGYHEYITDKQFPSGSN